MLDIIFILFVFIALITILLAIYLRGEDAYWNILFIVVSGVIWFVLSLLTTGGIETPYTAYNSTLGNSTMYYSIYAPAEFIFLSYFFGLMGVLCMIYLVVTIFGYYYEQIDKRNREKERESQEE